ncbi:DUF4129 domain-containing protein [Brachybacterium squillarum]|uniref:DUF4129 domain-containing protein n=1 Tax=Brachybacterium squillarum TaxID=661979 RepID=UPI002222D462|nr:DUF4129 domain-containing protein [Brachybacterium squillarum]MCW1806472.1 DUF4129 domain-containing protein [Brachybacterium squillarum]
MTPEEARRRLHEELAKREYADSEGFVAWVLHRLELWFTALMDGVRASSVVQGSLAVLSALFLVAVVVLVLRRTGLLRRSAGLAVSSSLVAESALTGAELREAAAQALTERRADDATVLALRALVRDLDERTLLEADEGLTAHEAAAVAARFFPDLRHRLERGATVFDTAAYSSRSAQLKDGEDLLRLAEYVAQSAPDLDAAPAPSPAVTAP